MALYRLAASLVVSGFMVACNTTGPRLSSAVEQRILRETTLDDMPEGGAEAGDGVVRIIRTGRAAGACSGALIGPRHVLTAAHCIVDHDAHHELVLTQLAAGAIHVELGGDYLPWGRVGVRHVRPCDGYTGDLAHDLAVLVLSKPVPTGVGTFELGYDIPSTDSQPAFELGGFGTSAKPHMMPGTSWPVFSVNRHVQRGSLVHVTDDVVVLQTTGLPGDSGGPIIDPRSGHLVSVVSRGTETKDDSTGVALRKPGTVTKPDEAQVPFVGGPRLYTCKKAIEETLERRGE